MPKVIIEKDKKVIIEIDNKATTVIGHVMREDLVIWTANRKGDHPVIWTVNGKVDHLVIWKVKGK